MDAETYQTRLEDNACTGAAGCKRPTEDGSSLCKRHRKMQLKRQQRSMAKLRDRWEADGRCRGCGTPKKLDRRCAVCAARRPERIRDEAVNAAVNATTSDPFRRDNDGWKRYRGKGRRGPPAAAVNDEQDLADATKALERGRQALAYARSPEVQALPKIQRAGVRNEALAHLGLVARTVEEVAARNRGKTASEGADGTWTYAKPADAPAIAQARAGEYVYAPPIDPPGSKKDPGARRTPPDLAPLRAALAARGFALAPEGAFYWVIVELPVVPGRPAPPRPGATP